MRHLLLPRRGVVTGRIGTLLLVAALAGCGGSATPESCLSALDAAEAQFRTFNELTAVYRDVALAASNQDATAVEAQTAKMPPLGDRVAANKASYDAAAAECRAARGES